MYFGYQYIRDEHNTPSEATMSYTDADHRFDAENFNGPCCPVHGRAGCACCPECGKPDGQHDSWCFLAESAENRVWSSNPNLIDPNHPNQRRND